MAIDAELAQGLMRLRSDARQRSTAMEERRLCWHCWGEGPAIALLHGGSGSWTHWLRNIDALVQAGRQVLVPDLPGFGDSDPPPRGLDADCMPPWIEAGLHELVGDEPVDMVGFSFGAMVGAFIAAQTPARVNRLVLVGAPALSREPMPALNLQAWNHLTDPDAQNAAHRHNLLALMLADPDGATNFTVALHSANLRRDRMTRRRISRTDILLRTLPDIRCPVFGIWGEHDVLYRNRITTLEPALASAPDFRGLTTIPDAGHWVQFEAAAAFDTTLARLLA